MKDLARLTLCVLSIPVTVLLLGIGVCCAGMAITLFRTASVITHLGSGFRVAMQQANVAADSLDDWSLDVQADLEGKWR